MKQGKLEMGRKLLQRSLQSLPKRKRKKIYLVMGNMPKDLIAIRSGAHKTNVTLCLSVEYAPKRVRGGDCACLGRGGGESEKHLW